ncbi:hypothetical protein ACLEPN_09685 [Myxococcus sp. 1LA]
MTDEEILTALRAEGHRMTPVQLAHLLDRLLGGRLGQGEIITFFKRAFPEIPLRTLLESGVWWRVSGGVFSERSDEEFNQTLQPWLPRRQAGDS